MTFFEEVQAYQRQRMAAAQARQAERIAELQPVVARMRAEWVGQLVRFYRPVLASMSPNAVISQEGWVYGEVVDIDEQGQVRVMYSVRADGRLSYLSGSLEDLGTCFVAVDALPRWNEDGGGA